MKLNKQNIYSSEYMFLMCCSGDIVKVLSVASGECIHQLKGHTKRITGILINPVNPYQLLSCSLDHSIIKWDYSDGLLVRQYHFEFPLFALYSVPSSEEATLFASRHKAKSNYELVQFHLPQDVEKKVKTNLVLPGIGEKENHVAVGYKGIYVAAVNSQVLQVCMVETHKKKEHMLTWEQGDKAFSCVSCHPREMCVATGVTDGQILLWYNIFNAKKVVKSVHHWHALEVRDIIFTTEGSYFLSGGHECVLVKWQTNTHHRDYKPRLGAPIVNLACSQDNTLYATCHLDNGIQVISSNFRVVQVFQGFTQGHLDQQFVHPLPAGLALDPRSNAIVTNGRPGHLQFYNIQTDKQLFNLDIVCQNYISPENLKQPLAVTEIEAVAFDSKGDWLVTVERWDDRKVTPELRLKFWQYKEETQGFQLNTTVERPHNAPVHTVKFRPRTPDNTTLMVVTASLDGKFKLWQVVDDTDIYRTNMCWNCESAGFYRNLAAGSTDFSEDGSLLGVAYGSSVTLWDPDTNTLKTTLPHGNEDGTVIHIAFSSHATSHLLVTTTRDVVFVWNLLACTVYWCLPLRVRVLVKDPMSNMLAAFTPNNELQVFSPKSSNMVYNHKHASKSPVVGALFVPHRLRKGKMYESKSLTWQKNSQLYFINSNQELLMLSDEDVAAASIQQIQQQQVALTQNLPQTPFSLLMSGKKRGGLQKTDPELTVAKVGDTNTQYLKQILSTPAHVLPPVSSLCMTFLDSLVIKNNKPGDILEKEEEEEDSDVEYSEEADQSESSDSEMETESPGGSTSVRKPNLHQQRTSTVPDEANAQSLHKTVVTADYSQVQPHNFDWLAQSR